MILKAWETIQRCRQVLSAIWPWQLIPYLWTVVHVRALLLFNLGLKIGILKLEAGRCYHFRDPWQVWCFINFSFCLSLYQRAQEEVHSKELKVKLLTDSVNSFIAKAPPTAHDALRSELDVLTANYQRLCSRLDGKCKTLEVWTLSSIFWRHFEVLIGWFWHAVEDKSVCVHLR